MPPKTTASAERSAAAPMPSKTAPAAGLRHAGGGRDPLQPIGRERLKALREAIRNGTYPSEEDVLGGLRRMLELD